MSVEREIGALTARVAALETRFIEGKAEILTALANHSMTDAEDHRRAAAERAELRKDLAPVRADYLDRKAVEAERARIDARAEQTRKRMLWAVEIARALLAVLAGAASWAALNFTFGSK